MKILVLVVLLSAIFQFMAAFMAIRLIRVSGALVAWVFLAAGLLVMGVRRVVTITHILGGLSRGDLTAEILAFLISLLLLCGISMIRPLFARIKRSQDELSEMHQKLGESEVRYRTVADFTSDWEFWLAPDDSFKYVSPSCEQVCGYTAEEFYRNPKLLLKIIHPEDLPQYENHIHNIQENGQAHPIDFRITTRDGQVRWIAHVCRTVVAADGSQLGQRASNRDITERKKAEEELRESERRYRELNEILEKRIAERQQAEITLAESENAFRATFEQAAVGMARVALDGRWLQVNQRLCDVVGYSREELLGLTDIWHPDDLEPGLGYLREMLARKLDTFSMETRCIHKDRSIIWVNLTVGLVRDTARAPAYFTYVVEDISKRKCVEEALAEKQRLLEELNRNLERLVAEAVSESRGKDRILMQQSRQAAMGEMISNIAHQWRQPLNTLGLIVQELLMTYGREEFNRESLEANVKKAMGLISHMSKTIEDFRNYFRPDKEKLLFNVKQAVDRTLSLVEQSLKGLGITIEVAEKDDAEINGYPNEYSQVLLNILINCRDAFEACSAGGQRAIVITILKENDRAVITVADNAGGIPENIMEKIFDPYFTTKSPDKGTGIGLYMSKTIIEKNMGGSLTVRNTAGGAEFRIEV